MGIFQSGSPTAGMPFRSEQAPGRMQEGGSIHIRRAYHRGDSQPSLGNIYVVRLSVATQTAILLFA
jgi:hypothetical protein